MTVQYHAYLDVDFQDDKMIPIAGFSLSEGYSAGWRAAALLISREEEPLTIGQMLGKVLVNRMAPGMRAVLYMVLGGESEYRDTVVRSWPCVISHLQPFDTGDLLSAGCEVGLVDPVTYLRNRTIWGTYRACSVGEMIGGALSMAAGGNGKPTLEPILPGLPSMRIVEDYRESLEQLPYSIAVGQSLRDWLRQMLGLLGLRLEMLGKSDGGIEIKLSDRPPQGSEMEMSVLTGDPVSDASEDDTASAGRLYISGLSAQPGDRRRGIVLDDPSSGGFRRANPGSVGYLFSGIEIGLDEAVQRSYFPVIGAYTSMLEVSAASRQPGLRPGRLVKLDQLIKGVNKWQLVSVDHRLEGSVYRNVATLLRGDTSWHSELPTRQPPLFVPGVIDGGTDYLRHEPIPRDRLGRIPVAFPFTPTPVGEEAQLLAVADKNRDRRIMLDDFSEADASEFANSAEWDAREEAFREGEYDDPHPDLKDVELSDEQKEVREEMLGRRKDVLRYVAYKQAKDTDAADRDRDGEISDRDLLVSDELSAVLRDPEQLESLIEYRETLKAEQEAMPEPVEDVPLHHHVLRDGDGMGTEDEGGADSEALADGDELQPLEEDSPAGEDSLVMPPEVELSDTERELERKRRLVYEYESLFGPSGTSLSGLEPDNEDEESNEFGDARRDAELAAERWPPRLPLSIIQLMAGGLHGFIPAHRQGDVCRVAVHDPLWAEVVGFQYRNDLPINVGIAGATAGIVVEHDTGDAWSGMVFRRTEDLDEALADATQGDEVTTHGGDATQGEATQGEGITPTTQGGDAPQGGDATQGGDAPQSGDAT